MRIRTKVWLLVGVSVLLTAAATLWLRIWAMRRELMAQASAQADEAAEEIKQALERADADAEDRDLAIVLHSYIQRHPRIQRLQLVVDHEASEGSIRIVAPRGEQPEINRLGPGPAYRQPEHVYTRQSTGENILPIERPIELKGPWKAALGMNWNLAPVESMILTTERWSLAVGVVHLVSLLLLAGFITDRVVVRRLEALARAMRDVEGGNLDRRVPAGSTDEVGLLSQGFNRMLEQLSSADKEIRAFSERLAQEIEAATQDLSKKNLALAQLNRLLNELRRENASKVRLATLGQLAAQLAHEIGTPLSSVSGHLQLALAQRELPPGLRDRLDVATREIARIGRIVRDYLDSTRSLAPERKPTSLSQVVAEAVEVTTSVDPGGSRRIEVEVRDEPRDFLTDPGLLRQIVINLLANALDAVERGGRVSLVARGEGSDVLITVSDTGAGIAADDLRRIFEPFYTTKGRGKGTGLGLAICRELAVALGGSITVESTPGAGSAFTVRLPQQASTKVPGSVDSGSHAFFGGAA